MNASERLIVGLDVDSVAKAETIVSALGPSVGFYKIGHQLAFSGGLDFARALVADGKQVFLDLKLLDIDNTVAKGVESVLRIGASMLTIHAYPKAMAAAVKAASGNGLTLLAVTVLTSMDADDLAQAGYSGSVEALVERRAAQARDAGMGGIVCASTEAAAVRAIVGPDLAIVTPGIRPTGSDHGDQKRVMTPGEALAAGSSHLVVARPIMAAADPKAAADVILADMSAFFQRKD